MEIAAEIALEAARRAGAEYADVRSVAQEEESVSVKDGRPLRVERRTDRGVGIRVFRRGAWGFAATDDLSDVSLDAAAARAVAIATESARVRREPIRLAPGEPARGHFAVPVGRDPFTVPMDTKQALLTAACAEMARVPTVTTTSATLGVLRTWKRFLSTEGADITQEITEAGAGIEAVATANGDTETRSYPSGIGGEWGTGGYDVIERLDLIGHARRTAEEAAMLLRVPVLPAGRRDIILDGQQMTLQLHESVGHPLEFDRILGMELSYAGGSFVRPEDIGRLTYGSPHLHVTADATVPGGLGWFGYDDEGVPAQRVDLIVAGRLVNVLTNRETAAVLGARSNGTARAESWRGIPLIRMTNINLLPGAGTLDDLISTTRDGVLFVTNRSWSIDDRRLHFRFGTEIAWEIRDGHLTQAYRRPAYTGLTPEFWAALDAVAGPEAWRMWGTPACGKGQPPQVAHVGHGVAPARFRQVEVGG